MKVIVYATIAAFLYFALKLILEKIRPTEEASMKKAEKQPLPITGAYKKRWLLTYNEKTPTKSC